MKPTDKVSIKLVAAQGKKILKGSKLSVNFIKKSKSTAKIAAGDVTEFSYTICGRVFTNADMAKIQKMRKKGFTQTEIAKTLGVGRHAIQCLLYQHMPEAANDRTGIMQALKDYFLSTSKKTRNSAFQIIDKYIENLAKENASSDSLSFEDYFQDLRLRFLEFAKRRKNKENVSPSSFYSALVYRPLTKSIDKSKTVPLNYLNNTAKEAAPFDSRIAKFEADNLREFLLEKDVEVWPYNTNLTQNLRSQAMMISYIKKGKSMDEIANQFGLTKTRIQSIIRNATRTLEKKYNFVVSGEDYKERIKIYQNIVDNLEKGQKKIILLNFYS